MEDNVCDTASSLLSNKEQHELATNTDTKTPIMQTTRNQSAAGATMHVTDMRRFARNAGQNTGGITMSGLRSMRSKGQMRMKDALKTS